jgi:membrane protease YdiL (CAAX protease family)
MAIFYNDKEPRIWWRLLMFLSITLFGIFVLHALLVYVHSPKVGMFRGMTPGAMLAAQEMVFVIPATVAGFVMGWFEHRPITSYGLVAGARQPRLILAGIVWGVGMMTALILLIRAFGGIQFSGQAIHGKVLLKSAALYGIGFLLVGFFEEFTFRGYMQKVLGERIGFWRAAVILSALFGAVHFLNGGESWVGALMAACFGIVSCLALKQTGSLWLSIGMHAGFDYAETFIFGVPDGGFPARNALMNATLHGPNWLTGGIVGPEGSVMAFVMLAGAFVLLWIIYSPRRPLPIPLPA